MLIAVKMGLENNDMGNLEIYILLFLFFSCLEKSLLMAKSI